MCVIIKHEFIHNSCYKIILYLMINDMITIVWGSFIPSYFLFQGYRFCNSPVLMYISASLSDGKALERFFDFLGVWVVACMTEIILAFNRIVALTNDRLNRHLFEGKRVIFWLIIPTCYGLYFIGWTTPFVFLPNMGLCSITHILTTLRSRLIWIM